MTDINDRLKEMQYKSLIELYEKVKQVAYERPLDSEDDEEEEIWNLIDDLEVQMDDFFKDKNVKGKIVKNVIKGHLAHDDIEKICIIDIKDLKVIYNGDLFSYMNPPEIMREEKEKYDNMIVKKSYVNGSRLDIFV